MTVEDSPDKITRRKLSDQVLDRLQALITSGELKPGDAMPSERALMARFGVGRPAVREALQSLHNSGLITISHGERSRVNAIDADLVLSQSDTIARLLLSSSPGNLQHLKQARQMFELGMVRLAAQQASREDIADLRRLVDQQRAHLGNAEAFVSADMAFHTKLAQISGNPIMAAVSGAMLAWLFEYHGALLHWSGKEEVTLAEHARIVDLIAARDTEGAVAEMARHLARAQDVFEAR
ncbi:transcriptional regulator NanR [Tropicibacter sp. S64]|uniref:transcriptional regulator NanR n=1 Tax=Tropicibacter sp. S64 TaxID=3415122 RepID=UPI003C7DF53B